MSDEQERRRFEEWVEQPPRKRSTDRRPDNHCCFPGKYVEYDVQLAWEAWLEAKEVRQ